MIISTAWSPAREPLSAEVTDLVMELIPEAEQGRSYGMPALKYRQNPLIGFLAARHHPLQLLEGND